MQERLLALQGASFPSPQVSGSGVSVLRTFVSAVSAVLESPQCGGEKRVA